MQGIHAVDTNDFKEYGVANRPENFEELLFKCPFLFWNRNQFHK